MAHVAHAAPDGAAQHIPTLTRPQGSSEGDGPPTATASASAGAAVCAVADTLCPACAWFLIDGSPVYQFRCDACFARALSMVWGELSTGQQPALSGCTW